jgi:hydrogenase maturation protease
MIPKLRILCLGNDLLADDAFGMVVAERLRRQWPSLDVVETPATGLDLIDYLQDTSRLIVIDSVQTSTSPPGTLYLLRDSDVKSLSGPSPHYIGLFETLALARKLLIPTPEEVTILAVEVADCTSLGGRMHPAVQAAVLAVVDLVGEIAQVPAGLCARG